MATIGALIYRIGTDLSDLVENTKKIEGRLDGMASLAKKAGAALGAAFAIQGIGQAIGAFTELTGQLTDLSAKTGISTTELQKLKFAAEQNGGSLEQVTSGIAQMANRLVGGDKSAVSALKTMGLSLDQLRAMQPGEAFTTIADAVAKVPNPLEQSKLAMDLFGKSGADLLPLMKGGLSETAAAAERLGLVLDEQVVAAGDQFGDTLDVLKGQGMALIASVLKPLLPILQVTAELLIKLAQVVVPALGTAIGWVTTKVLELYRWFVSLLATMAEAAQRIPLVGKHLGFAGDAAAWLRTHADGVTGTIDRLNTSSEKTATSVGKMVPPFRDLGAGAKEGAKEAAKALKDLEQRMEETQQGLMKGWGQFAHYLRTQIAPVFRGLGDLMTPSMALLTVPAGGVGDRWGKVPMPYSAAFGGAFASPVTGGGTATGMTAFLGQLPGTVLSALTGGGSLTKSIGSLFGGSMMSSLMSSSVGKSLTGALTGSLGKTLGGAIGNLIPGVGALLGPALSWVGGLFGPGKEYQEVKGQRGQFEASFGGMEAMVAQVSKAYETLGRSGAAADQAIKALWNAKTAKDYEAAVRNIQSALSAANTELERQAQIKTQIAGIEGQIAALEAQQVPTLAQLEDIASRYNINVFSLGENFGKLKVTEAARKILSDFERLKAANLDVNGALVGMQEEISQLVQDALRFGTTLPANFKALAEQLMASGRLVDANGVALQSLAGIQWGEAVKTDAEIVRDAMAELVATLKDLKDSLLALPSSLPNPTAGWSVPGVNPWMEFPETAGAAAGTFGGLVSSSGIRYLATGGPARILAFRPRGVDRIPAMLAEGEYVMSASAVSRYGPETMAALNRGVLPTGGAGAGTHITQIITMQLDRRTLARAVAEDLPAELRLVGAA